jgi:hypothetical protein
MIDRCQLTYRIQALVNPELIYAVLEPPGVKVSRCGYVDIVLKVVAIVFPRRARLLFRWLVVPVASSHKIEWNA